jgi:hypothetical protein
MHHVIPVFFFLLFVSMVQGLVKKTNATKAKQRENKKANQPKKGARVIAPKKASLIKQKQLQKASIR